MIGEKSVDNRTLSIEMTNKTYFGDHVISVAGGGVELKFYLRVRTHCSLSAEIVVRRMT